MSQTLFFAVILALLNTVTYAAVYRCASSDGAPIYQQSPCAANARPLKLAPLNTLGDGLRPGERRLLKALKQPRTKTTQPRVPPSAGPEKRRQAKQCLRKRQQCDALRAKLRRGYKPAQGDALRRRRDNCDEYLRTLCE